MQNSIQTWIFSIDINDIPVGCILQNHYLLRLIIFTNLIKVIIVVRLSLILTKGIRLKPTLSLTLWPPIVKSTTLKCTINLSTKW